MTVIDMRIPWRYLPHADAQFQQRNDGTIVVRSGDLSGSSWYGEGASVEAALDDLSKNFNKEQA